MRPDSYKHNLDDFRLILDITTHFLKALSRQRICLSVGNITWTRRRKDMRSTLGLWVLLYTILNHVFALPQQLICNGDSGLCDRRWDNVTVIGSHDSFAFTMNPFQRRCFMHFITGNMTKQCSRPRSRNQYYGTIILGSQTFASSSPSEQRSFAFLSHVSNFIRNSWLSSLLTDS